MELGHEVFSTRGPDGATWHVFLPLNRRDFVMAEEWWTKAYPGGPMVAVLGFPRPLYPPDAAAMGKTPSVAGSDIEGIKRTVSRAGRWTWQQFDQAYSNGFAHGLGRVGESGIAGIQAVQKIPTTGWIGKETFNCLRSIRIPEGLPHAGEPAMDARSVELINAAWQRFGGQEPEPKPSRSSARARLDQAITQLGVSEDPPNSNQCLYTDWYGMVGPWCAMFATWADETGGRPSKSLVRGVSYAYVPYIVSDARLGLNGLSVSSTPQPGDLVCFDWEWNGEFDHVELVETPPNGVGDFTTIGGNTSPEGSNGSQSNGGEVCRRKRNTNFQGTVFVRVEE